MSNPSELFNRTVSIEPRTNGKVTKIGSFNKDMKRQWYGIYMGKKDSELVNFYCMKYKFPKIKVHKPMFYGTYEEARAYFNKHRSNKPHYQTTFYINRK